MQSAGMSAKAYLNIKFLDLIGRRHMIIKLLKSIGFLLFFFSITFYFFLIMWSERLYYYFKRIPYTSELAHSLATRWGQSFLNLMPGWTLVVEGKEHLPKQKKPYVIVANHESGTDILAIYFLGIQFRWLSKDSIFKIPMIGQAMKLSGYVPIIRGDKDSHTKAMKISKRVVQSGIPMLFFPEGTRSTTGSLKAFKSGAFRLANKCNAPVLPIVLHGAGTLLKKKSLAPNVATVRVKILPLMHQTADESAGDFCSRVREKMILAHYEISNNHNKPLKKSLKKETKESHYGNKLMC